MTGLGVDDCENCALESGAVTTGGIVLGFSVVMMGFKKFCIGI